MLNILDIRIADVLISGPLQIYVSTYLHGFLKIFMFVTGVCNIIYNGHNYLTLNNYIKPIYFIEQFVSKNGKYQIHRIYNLIVMYPIFLYIVLYQNLPKYVYILLACDIILGYMYNLYYLLKVMENNYNKNEY